MKKWSTTLVMHYIGFLQTIQHRQRPISNQNWTYYIRFYIVGQLYPFLWRHYPYRSNLSWITFLPLQIKLRMCRHCILMFFRGTNEKNVRFSFHFKFFLNLLINWYIIHIGYKKPQLVCIFYHSSACVYFSMVYYSTLRHRGHYRERLNSDETIYKSFIS